MTENRQESNMRGHECSHWGLFTTQLQRGQSSHSLWQSLLSIPGLQLKDDKQKVKYLNPMQLGR